MNQVSGKQTIWFVTCVGRKKKKNQNQVFQVVPLLLKQFFCFFNKEKCLENHNFFFPNKKKNKKNCWEQGFRKELYEVFFLKGKKTHLIEI